jgi:hypothetical protein
LKNKLLSFLNIDFIGMIVEIKKVDSGIKFVDNLYCLYNYTFKKKTELIFFSRVFIIDYRKLCNLIRSILVKKLNALKN